MCEKNGSCKESQVYLTHAHNQLPGQRLTALGGAEVSPTHLHLHCIHMKVVDRDRRDGEKRTIQVIHSGPTRSPRLLCGEDRNAFRIVLFVGYIARRSEQW